MSMRFLGSLLALSLTGLAAHADELVVPEMPAAVAPEIKVEAEAPPALPAKGMLMSDVEKKFGEPKQKYPAVGGAPRQPPITRWDYDGFVVFFERTHVVDAVIPEAPAPIYNKDQLEAAP